MANLVIMFFDDIGINKYIIKLIKKKQLLYSHIYASSLIELKTLKAYIKTHLKVDFILGSKFLASILIFLIKNIMIASDLI